MWHDEIWKTVDKLSSADLYFLKLIKKTLWGNRKGIKVQIRVLVASSESYCWIKLSLWSEVPDSMLEMQVSSMSCINRPTPACFHGRGMLWGCLDGAWGSHIVILWRTVWPSGRLSKTDDLLQVDEVTLSHNSNLQQWKLQKIQWKSLMKDPTPPCHDWSTSPKFCCYPICWFPMASRPITSSLIY